MNNKGFTLVELIATIALLAVISVISFVSINSIIQNNKVSNCENLVGNIKNAVKEYVSDNRYNKDFVDSIPPVMLVSIYGSELIDKNYLTSPITNPYDTSKILDSSKIFAEVSLNRDYSVNAVTVKYSGKGTINCSLSTWWEAV